MAEAEELIVDFPTHRSRSMKPVHFADTSTLYIVHRHEDDNKGVHRHDLWYNKTDYSRMKLANQKSVIKVRALASAGVPVTYSGDGGSSDDCLIGIEHLLTPATVREALACKQRCVRAVLGEQERQAMMNPSADEIVWDNIANASFVETRRAAVRAQKLGKLHHDSI